MDKVINISTPITDEVIKEIQVGDRILISGYIYCGRDAVLPKVCEMISEGVENKPFDFLGNVMFHTAVSPAGVGPTSSNKLEIESSFETLSMEGIKIHLGKGKIGEDTIKKLEENNSVYAVIPPVTALLGHNTLESKVVAFEELGMEALHLLKVVDYPAIIAVAHGKSIY